MPRPRFSEMLVNRRRQLGLSVAQASRVLRLREDVLIAFENGDFGRMPKSGYAQGMLSSYARYLGLSPRSVVRQFSSDLFDYERGRDGRHGGEEASYEVPGSSSPRRPYQGSRGLLPTSGGFAGDVTGFATTSPVRSRQQSSPLVNQRQSPSRYHQGGDVGGDLPAAPTRRYTGRDVSSRPGSRARTHRSRRPEQGRAIPGSYREEVVVPRGNADRVTTRLVDADAYTDDLRYGDARPYEAASTRTGRRSSRNIARAERPNVRRRGGEGRESLRARGRGGAPRRSGVAGVVEAYFSDARRTMATVVIAGALLLTLIIIGSVKSCVRAPSSSDARSVAVTTTSTTPTDSSSETTATTSGTQGQSSQAADEAAKAAEDAKAQKEAKEAETETKVDVKVADGATTWLEIESDGTSVIAEQVTGPWEKSFVVTESITVQVSDTTAATVTKNGTQQSFSSKSSGIGSITIQGTKPSANPAESTAKGKADTSSSDASASDAPGEGGTASTSGDESSGSTVE